MKKISMDNSVPFTQTSFLSLLKVAKDRGAISKIELTKEALEACLEFKSNGNEIVKSACDTLSEDYGDAPITVGDKIVIFIK